MKILIHIILLLLTIKSFGQNVLYYKTVGKTNVHYIEISREKIIIYNLGWTVDKAESGPIINNIDTLIKKDSNTFLGATYTIRVDNNKYLLNSPKFKSQEIIIESNLEKVYTELNNAYCLSSYFKLSNNLNKEFPMYHYSFRNGFYAWNIVANKSISPKIYKLNIDKTINLLYDSISSKQRTFTNTTNYILNNASLKNYNTLRDSLKTLPIDCKPNCGYFDKAVYSLSKSNPENIFKIIEDFPSSTTLIYFAVSNDKKLTKQIKSINIVSDAKKKFMVEYKNFNKFGLKTIGTGALSLGVLIGIIALINR
jgi:hypothetical protein